MSHTTGPQQKPDVSQKEYLKRYLSKEKADKKKKKKVKVSSSSHLKRSIIIDDDLGLPNVASIEDEEFNLDYLGDEAPQIAGIIDERPPEIKAKENYGGNKWKPVGEPEESDLIQKNVIENVDPRTLNGKSQYRDNNNKSDAGDDFSKGKNKTIKEDSGPLKERLSSDSDMSPPRSKDNGYEKDKKYYKERNRRDDDSDLSPPRSKTKGAGKEHFTKRLSSDSDLSPPRSKGNGYEKHKKYYKKRNTRDDDSDLSPPRSKTKGAGKEHFSKRYSRDDDSDLSPPRSKTKGIEKDSFSKRTLKHNQSHSLSPRSKTKSHMRESSQFKRHSRASESPIRDQNRNHPIHSSHSKSRTKGSDSDLSPPRKYKYKGKTNRNRDRSESDLSPPRNSKYEEKSKKRRPDFEPDFSSKKKSKYEEKSERRGSDSEISPSRKNKHDGRVKRRGSDSDLSPPRKNKHDGRVKRRGSDSDLSPPRKNKHDGRVKRRGSDSDLSPPRKNKHDGRVKRHAKGDVSHYSPQRKNKQEVKENINMDKTLDGKKAGLQDAKNLKEELRKLKEAENALYEKMKASVSGKTATAILRDRKTGKIRDLNKEREEESKKNVKVAERENKYAKWGKGLKQIEEAEDRVADYLHEINKPLARYAGDDDLEKVLKAREREGDPMLDYIKNKQSESIDLETTGKPTYRGYYLPNRFNIRPGHRWDGVSRSNGYEKQWFERQNAKKALQEEAYKWSTSDM